MMSLFNRLNTEYKCVTERRAGAARLSLVRTSEGKKLVLFKRGTVLKWLVRANDFDDKATVALRDYFNKAIATLGVPETSIKFEMVLGSGSSHHITIMSARTKGIYANSFFPPQAGDLAITPEFFNIPSEDRRVNVLVHELGHIIGMRHEFAEDEDSDHVEMGESNTLSFMDYTTFTIQDSDRDLLELLYGQIDNDDRIKKVCKTAKITFERGSPVAETKKVKFVPTDEPKPEKQFDENAEKLSDEENAEKPSEENAEKSADEENAEKSSE